MAPHGRLSLVVRWAQFETQRPDLAEAGRAMLYQYGVGLAFLGTVRADGGPRLHPMCPLLMDGGLYAFLIQSPKRDDLHRDPRYAIHTFPCDDNEDAFYIAGSAAPVRSEETKRALGDLFVAERPGLAEVDFEAQEAFEFSVERCLWSTTTGHGDPDPSHVTWRAESVDPGQGKAPG